MSDQMMHVLHVSKYDFPMKVTRVVLGCSDMTDDLEGKLLVLGYCVWRTFEQTPDRSHEEQLEAQQLLENLF